MTTGKIPKLRGEIYDYLKAMDANQGTIIGGDYNVITNKELDQIGYENHHPRTKATKQTTGMKREH